MLFGLLVLGFSLFTKGLDRILVTAPLVFVAIGSVIGFGIGPSDPERVVGLKVIAEVTLVLILFHDAATVRPGEIGGDRGPIMRLLFIGLPLTMLAGWGVATLLFPGVPLMLALLLAAALAPTDAGLGAPTVLNPVVPTRIRRLLNVESGLNDGLATPIVLFAVAAYAGSEGVAPGESAVEALIEIALGTLVGVAAGTLGGLLIGWSKRRGLSSHGSRALATLMIPLLAYGGALMISGNGFVAAFLSGTAFAGAARWLEDEDDALELTEQLANPLGYAVWLVFGVTAVPSIWRGLGWNELLFALLALTVLRMVPVAIALLGSGFRPPSVLFIGWFGPRGLASIVFALIALESLELNPAVASVLVTISMTVMLSVVAHGVSAEPLAARYGAWVERVRPPAELQESNQPRTRDARLWA